MPLLILGGARSGKSGVAERTAAASGKQVIVIVTADPPNPFLDNEMAERIEMHKRARPAHWHTVEAPVHLAAALQEWSSPDRHVIVDCLTLWLTNILLRDAPLDVGMSAPGPHFERERQALLDALPNLLGPVCLVSNEVGHGIVPLGALNRRYVDESGRLHQAVAKYCEQVLFVMAGCTLSLKGGTW